MNKKLNWLVLVPASALLFGTLTACASNEKKDTAAHDKASSGKALTVSSTDDACKVSAAEATSGNVTFQIKNDGSKTTEFYLLGKDGLQIVAEKENIAPGSSAELTALMQPGDYFTACKPGMRGSHVGKAAFTVTGNPVKLSGQDQELLDAAVTKYVDFVKNEVQELEPLADEFAKAYINGDDAKAKKMFASMRTHYERIEPIAEALGSLDPRLDYREIDYLAEADQLKKDDPTFTQWLGFHRIEKDLWPPAADAKQPDGTSALDGWSPSTPEKRKEIGETLVSDVKKLNETVSDPNFIKDQGLNISSVSNGASDLLEEIAKTKVTGEEDWWSHYDLWDFQANLQGAKIAYDLVKPIAERKGEEGKKLTADIDRQFAKLQAVLDKYGSLEKGYTMYNEVTAEQQRELVDQIEAVRDPLSKLTATVLGIE